MSLALVCVASHAQAQAFNFTGLLTGHVGVAASDDVRDSSATPGVSMAVVDGNGIGAEIDIARLGDFDNTRFTESSVASAMLNVIVMRPLGTWRPFGLLGAGVMRVSAEAFEGRQSVRRTEGGWTTGGGAFYMVSEIIAIRGDLRYFRYFSDYDDLPLAGDGVLDFWRTSVGVTLAWPIR
jgi:opacity protein-like surface antigen